jgi:hypothetical protein
MSIGSLTREEQPGPGEAMEYKAFWQENVEKVEEINHRLENALYSLEKKYLDFEGSYRELTDLINLLVSLYSSFNNIPGVDYLLKLRALIQDYKTRYTHAGIEFNVVYYLHSKLKELIASGMDDFPAMSHHQQEQKAPDPDPGSFRYKWLCLKRNRTWFLLQYDEIGIVEGGDAVFESMPNDHSPHIRHRSAVLPVIDYALTSGEVGKANFYVIATLHGTVRCFACSRLGKKIYAGRDIFKESVKETGGWRHIRLFGERHLII